MRNEKPQSKIKKVLKFFLLSSIAGSIFLFPPLISQAAIAITPPDHFVGDGALDSGTASLIKVNIINEEPGDYYLKAYFYPPSNAQARFGYVWNPTTSRWVSTWQKNSEQLQIKVASGKEWDGVPVKGLWQGEISVKTDIEKSGYLGSGDYILKVRATPVATGHVIEISTKTSIIEPSTEPSGTPKQTNSRINAPQPTPQINYGSSTPIIEPEFPEGSSLGMSSPAPERTPLKNTYPKNIFINEVLPAPEGPDEQNEWIEIANNNNFAVDLAKWRLKDTIGATKTYTFPEKSVAPANGFLVVYRTESKIALQNSGDGLELFNPEEKLADKVEFPKSPNNQSYNRVLSAWQWSKILTPGLPNQISAANKLSEQNKSIASNLSTASDSRLLANIALNANKKSGITPRWPTIFSFIIGLTVAAASTAGALYFKKGQVVRAKAKAAQQNKKSTV